MKAKIDENEKELKRIAKTASDAEKKARLLAKGVEVEEDKERVDKAAEPQKPEPVDEEALLKRVEARLEAKREETAKANSELGFNTILKEVGNFTPEDQAIIQKNAYRPDFKEFLNELVEEKKRKPKDRDVRPAPGDKPPPPAIRNTPSKPGEETIEELDQWFQDHKWYPTPEARLEYAKKMERYEKLTAEEGVRGR